MITFRYAGNIAAGKGFVYNEGERVQGTSTPLFTLLLTLFNILGIHSTPASLLIGFVSFVTTAVMIYLIAEKIHSPQAGALSVLILIANGSFMMWQHQGMETPFYCAIIVLSFYLMIKGQWWFAPMPALVRLDGLLIGAAMVLGLAVSHLMKKGSGNNILRSKEFRHVIFGFICLFLPWFMFAFLYFGNIFPQSMLAKQYHFQAVSRWWMGSYLLTSPLFLLSISSVYLLRKNSYEYWNHIIVFVLYILMYIISFSLVQLGEAYEWYLPPVIMMNALLSGIVVIELYKRIRKKFSPSPRIEYIVGGALLIAFIALCAITFRRTYIEKKDWAKTIEQTRVNAAAYVRDHFPSSSTVCAGAIGHIGYTTQMRVIDWLGLMTPGAVGKSIDEVIHNFQPDIIIGHELREGEFTPTNFKALSAYPFHKIIEYPRKTEWGVYHVYSRNPPQSK